MTILGRAQQGAKIGATIGGASGSAQTVATGILAVLFFMVSYEQPKVLPLVFFFGVISIYSSSKILTGALKGAIGGAAMGAMYGVGENFFRHRNHGDFHEDNEAPPLRPGA